MLFAKFLLMKIIHLFLIIVVFTACKKDAETVVSYDSKAYVLNTGTFPTPAIAADNSLTQATVQLGRMLFYEKRLSKDNTQSCATCHAPENSFNDIRQFSIGVEGLKGKRNAMTVINLAWHNQGFFWDGRATLLRDQALKPIQDPLEMNESLDNVVKKLKSDKSYTDHFTKAFKNAEINPLNISLALEQFMNTMVSFNSKYDNWQAGTVQLTDSEERGRNLFFNDKNVQTGMKGAGCFHCHGGFEFTNHNFTNNGLDNDYEFVDLGRYNVTNNDIDKARFKTPTLRNIEYTPPYMHDGRFATLDEVIEHYNVDVKFSSTLDPIMTNVAQGGLELSASDKADLINFLKTLSDVSFNTNPNYVSPF